MRLNNNKHNNFLKFHHLVSFHLISSRNNQKIEIGDFKQTTNDDDDNNETK